MYIKNAQQIIRSIDTNTHTHTTNQFTMKLTHRSEKSIDRFVFPAVIPMRTKTKNESNQIVHLLYTHSHCQLPLTTPDQPSISLGINPLHQNNCIYFACVACHCIEIFFIQIFFCCFQRESDCLAERLIRIRNIDRKRCAMCTPNAKPIHLTVSVKREKKKATCGCHIRIPILVRVFLYNSISLVFSIFFLFRSKNQKQFHG